jgi:hypothetical protein
MYQTDVVTGAILPGSGTPVIGHCSAGESGGKINVSLFLLMK